MDIHGLVARCRLLLAGEGELGQEAAAGALLRLLEGLEVHAISLPALIVAGNGDACQGCVSLIHEALRRCVMTNAITYVTDPVDGLSLTISLMTLKLVCIGPQPRSHASSTCREWKPGRRTPWRLWKMTHLMS